MIPFTYWGIPNDLNLNRKIRKFGVEDRPKINRLPVRCWMGTVCFMAVADIIVLTPISSAHGSSLLLRKALII